MLSVKCEPQWPHRCDLVCRLLRHRLFEVALNSLPVTAQVRERHETLKAFSLTRYCLPITQRSLLHGPMVMSTDTIPTAKNPHLPKVRSVKTRVGQNIDLHTSPTARKFPFRIKNTHERLKRTLLSCIVSSKSDLFNLLPRWGAADAKFKVPSGENTELKHSPFKAWSRYYIAIHATLTARDFFLAYFYPSGPFTYIFPKPLAILPVLAIASTWFLCRPAESNKSPCQRQVPMLSARGI